MSATTEMEEQKKKKNKLSKDTVNIIRTTQRNNIELTHIADNKANVLLSLNAIMITFLIPLILANITTIFDRFLFVPLIILASTCFTTIYIAAIVLKPSRFENFRSEKTADEKFSPFFFGNFYKMDPDEFIVYIKSRTAEPEQLREHLAQDLYYVGKRLGFKMTWIRRSFNIFLIGIFLTLVSLGVVLALF